MRGAMTAGALLLATACQGQADSLQPGHWETKTELISLMGITPRHGGPVSTLTVSHCVTPEEAARPDANFMTGNDADSGCAYREFSMASGRIQGVVRCAAADMTMHAVFSGEYRATSFQTTMRGEVTKGAVPVEMESRSRGRRTGDC
jgi:hypothetical protein